MDIAALLSGYFYVTMVAIWRIISNIIGIYFNF